MANQDGTFFQLGYYEAAANNCPCPGASSVSVGEIGAVFAPSAVDSKLGTDIDGIFDTGTMLTLASGLKNLGNALCRRLITPRGALFYDPEYGYDVRSFLNKGFTPDQLAAVQDQIAAEVEKDDRIQDATVTVVTDISAMSMQITIVAEISEGPYAFIISVDRVTARLLSAQEVS
jgi:hypothetical protein